MTRVLVHGAGRMARRVLAEMPGFENYQLAGLVARTEPTELPGIDWYGSLQDFTAGADLLIDFTLPGGTRVAAEWCGQNRVALLSGTTGLSEEDIQALKNTAKIAPVLWAPNLSYGIALLNSLVRQAARALGAGTKVHIADLHHQHKLDAPSGTALALAASVVAGRKQDLQNLLEPGRLENPLTGEEGGLTFSSKREGEVIGEHTVSFTLADEVIELSHKAVNRELFAKGALRAGEWLVRQAPGYYSTGDWLGLD